MYDRAEACTMCDCAQVLRAIGVGEDKACLDFEWCYEQLGHLNLVVETRGLDIRGIKVQEGRKSSPYGASSVQVPDCMRQLLVSSTSSTF